MNMKILMIILGTIAHGFAAAYNGRIVGGKVAERGQFPYQVSLDHCGGTYCDPVCGGAILSPNWILTAGHCIEYLDTSYRVVAGVIDLDDDDAIEAKQVVSVLTTIVHPEFAETTAAINDIALVKLSKPLIFSDQVRPVKLPEPGFEAEGWTVIAGWGLTNDGYPNLLMFAELPIIPTSVCGEIYDKLLNITSAFDGRINMCTGPLTGEYATCIGDSGSPVVQDETIVGIVSWGMMPCAYPGYPSVETKVSHYLDFIKEHVVDI